MDKTDFVNILELTMADAKVIDDSVIGVAVMILHRTADGEVDLQIGCNVPRSKLLQALENILLHEFMKDCSNG